MNTYTPCLSAWIKLCSSNVEDYCLRRHWLCCLVKTRHTAPILRHRCLSQSPRHRMKIPCPIFRNPSRNCNACKSWTHKVLTCVEYRAVSGVFQNIDPPPPLHPAPKAGGYTLAGRWGGGGSIFWKTLDNGLASYSIIPLRLDSSVSKIVIKRRL